MSGKKTTFFPPRSYHTACTSSMRRAAYFCALRGRACSKTTTSAISFKLLSCSWRWKEDGGAHARCSSDIFIAGPCRRPAQDGRPRIIVLYPVSTCFSRFFFSLHASASRLRLFAHAPAVLPHHRQAALPLPPPTACTPFFLRAYRHEGGLHSRAQRSMAAAGLACILDSSIAAAAKSFFTLTTARTCHFSRPSSSPCLPSIL